MLKVAYRSTVVELAVVHAPTHGSNNSTSLFVVLKNPMISRSMSTTEMGGVPQQASAGQEEGVLHSVLEDLLEGRVASTLVNNPVHGL